MADTVTFPMNEEEKEIDDKNNSSESSGVDDTGNKHKTQENAHLDYDGILSALKSFGKALSVYTALPSKLPEIADAVIAATQRITQIIEKIDFDAIIKSVEVVQQGINDFVKNLQIPTITEERRQELLDAYRTWGKLGWTPHPNEKARALLIAPPQEKKDADQKALIMCKDFTVIFNALRSQKRAKTKDLEEAISDFKDKRYKSCALILFSLIDALLIRFQRNKETQGKRRAVGFSAVLKAKERVDVDEQTGLLVSAIYSANVFACLGKIFEDGKDFKDQPSIINRNFVDHGMLTHPVRKKDCLQLFLLLYNWMELVNYEYSKNNKH